MTNESKHLDYLKHFKSKIFNIKNIMKPLRVGTDCSGIEAPLQALNLLNIPYKHILVVIMIHMLLNLKSLIIILNIFMIISLKETMNYHY